MTEDDIFPGGEHISCPYGDCPSRHGKRKDMLSNEVRVSGPGFDGYKAAWYCLRPKDGIWECPECGRKSGWGDEKRS